MHFKHISAKVQPKNLKQHFDWGARASWAPLVTPLLGRILFLTLCLTNYCGTKHRIRKTLYWTCFKILCTV